MKTKKGQYSKKIKNVNPKYWHRELKKLTSFDQFKSEEIVVEDIKELSNKAQAECIADRFAAISQEFDRIKDEDIDVPQFSEYEIPQVSVEEVRDVIAQMDSNKSNVENDIPAKVLKHFAKQICFPVTNVINTSIKQGCWPEILQGLRVAQAAVTERWP